ncbi:MAG: membrane protein insertion efficiency factor YidD [Oscillospiraceae bacterium]|nr:membrane protein insertion efficiency factor YidD [Oscillospiraceae bacterium]MDD6083597.1 membrane protein insertion efficiency factor YidD [Oscillospiraceae bacterium]
MKTYLVRLYLFPVRFYRRFISPLTPPCCRFTPTCSAYAVKAVERFGIIKGTVLAVWRILRCNPFCRGGYDDVPEEFSFVKKKRQDGGDKT